MIRAVRHVSTSVACESNGNLPADLEEEKHLEDGLKLRESYYRCQ